MFPYVNPRQSFPELEKEIIEYWKKNDIFKKSVENRPHSEEFSFYDGPPFATGTPHYGHILAGAIKDVIPRYQTMLGKKVERRFGWDCHGLPIENIVEKKLWISGKDDIEGKVWVYEFNETCRENVFGYVDDWRSTVERMGRWVDMDHDYKTMDASFMESVWWVFKTIYDKWLIYEGNRIVAYCPRCETPLSNFEVNQGYADKQSKTVTAKFLITGEKNRYILAWTTTPWTLVSNLWLAVGEKIEYSEVYDKKSDEYYILASEKLKDYYKNEDDYEVKKTYTWKELEGISYEPLFPDFVEQLRTQKKDLWSDIHLWENVFHVIIGHHVTTEAGTGIVHIAPAYGEDDFILWKSEKLGFVAHINDSGRTYNLLEDNNMFVFDYNEHALQLLKTQKKLVNIATVTHSYPHCWRCGTPLIYRAIPAWYVAVEKIRDQMVANNQDITWVPENIKNGRFWKWLEWAKDWNISRNRYWGSAIPVWQSEDKKEEICVGSVQELYELNRDFGQIEEKEGKYYYTDTGKEIDLHKHFVDKIFVKHPKTGNKLTRIPEVLDCWFESGSMPYGSKHYPFENADFRFPADFIAEGLDQTRGWFYTLLILGTALFDKTPFLNCITNGIILAEDGKKMSKSLKNYTDPTILMDKFWADAMRFYLLNSPVVEAQDFRFSDAGVEEVVKKIVLPLWNAYSFFTTYANIDGFEPQKGNIYFVRHGRTDMNDQKRLSGGENDVDINETGIAQAHALWKQLAAAGIKIDAVFVSPMIRTKHTADIVLSYLDYTGEIIETEWLREHFHGECSWLTFEEISEKYHCVSVFRRTTWEKEDIFEKRVLDVYQRIEQEYAGKNILIFSHGGVMRPMNRYLHHLSYEDAYYRTGWIQNAVLHKLPNIRKENDLDKWIVSELHILTGEMRKWFDSYKLNQSSKPLVTFLDNLTNWYIRRSRKRFWENGLSGDKKQAYETLYEVLVETTKLIAPYMPFVSEYIFTRLSGKESVHLELFPEKCEAFILRDLSENMRKVKDIVAVGLSARASEKIRVRQPLQRVKIPFELTDEKMIEIIKDELNVKEVLVFAPNEFPRQICKPDARQIGPKFGKDVKEILQKAKSGDFEVIEEEGKKHVKVGEFVLLEWEYEIEFIASENTPVGEILQTGNGICVALDTRITPELKNEGYARDIVRHVQEARKEANFNVDDRIQIVLEIPQEYENILADFGDMITEETLSTLIEYIEKADLEKEIELDDFTFTVKLKK